MYTRLLSLLLIAMIALSGCARDEPEPEPTPTPTVEPVVVVPTDTPVPTPEVDLAPAVDEESPDPPTPTPRPRLPTTMTSPDYGAQAFLWWRPEIASRDLQLMRDAGFVWVKQWFAWRDVEGAGKGVFDWSRTDRIVEQAEDNGLKLMVRTDLAPDWAGQPPEAIHHYVDYLAALAARYQGRIHAYQVWNEPNLAREWWDQRPNPQQYVEMLRLSYQAIKAADPDAIVVSAGMAPTGTDSEIAMPDDRFYELMYEAMGGSSDGYFDMLGVHAAGFAAAPEISPDEAAADNERYGGERFFTFRRVEDIRAIMERYGDADKRVVVLEMGWTTDPINPDYAWHGAGAGITEEVKADYLVRAYEYARQNWQPWIALMSVIYMPDFDWTEQDEQYWWSIMAPSAHEELNFRPAYLRLCEHIREQRGLGSCPWNE